MLNDVFLPVNISRCFKLLWLCLLFVRPSAVFSEEFTGNCFVTMGELITKSEISDSFHVDQLAEIGISLDVTKKNWPLAILFESSYLYARSHIPGSAETEEKSQRIFFVRSDVYLGAKRIFHVNSMIKPNIFGGVSLVRLYSEKDGHSDSATNLGYFFGAGIFFKITEHFSCGVQWKQSFADVTIQGRSVDAGGHHLSAIAGYSF